MECRVKEMPSSTRMMKTKLDRRFHVSAISPDLERRADASKFVQSAGNGKL
jgi:hypothetical protein